MILLIKPFFYMTKKPRDKKYLEYERAFEVKEKAFFIIFSGISLKQIKQILLEG